MRDGRRRSPKQSSCYVHGLGPGGLLLVIWANGALFSAGKFLQAHNRRRRVAKSYHVAASSSCSNIQSAAWIQRKGGFANFLGANLLGIA